MRSFQARFKGLCLPCGQYIERNEPIVSYPDVGYVHEACADDVGRVLETETEPRPTGRVRQSTTFLPRGKTAKDRCGQCFQVPASNGACGCQG